MLLLTSLPALVLPPLSLLKEGWTGNPDFTMTQICSLTCAVFEYSHIERAWWGVAGNSGNWGRPRNRRNSALPWDNWDTGGWTGMGGRGWLNNKHIQSKTFHKITRSNMDMSLCLGWTMIWVRLDGGGGVAWICETFNSPIILPWICSLDSIVVT